MYLLRDIVCDANNEYPYRNQLECHLLDYHIFEINAFKQLTHLDSVADYREAKKIVNEHRNRPQLPAGTTFRMMFAQDVQQAEKLLKEKREPRPMGEHD